MAIQSIVTQNKTTLDAPDAPDAFVETAQSTAQNRQTDVTFFLPNLTGGGAERVMLNLAIGFANQGFVIDFVLVKAEGDYLSEVPPNVRIVDLNTARLLTGIPAFIQYLQRTRPTVLISALEDVNLVAILATKWANVPTRVIVSVHNQLSLESKHTKDIKRKIVPHLLRWLYPMADSIVAASQGVAADLSQISGLPLDRINAIYNPIVTAELLSKIDQTVSHPWFMDSQESVILAVGRLTAQKDFPTLIHAFAQLRHAFAQLHQVRSPRLIILGEGEDRAQLEALIHRLGLSSVVDLPGFVVNPYAYMARAQVVVLSSAWEGFGNVLVESMAAGTAVVATDCPSGPAEILANGQYGKLVPVGDVQSLATAILATLEMAVNGQVNGQELRQRSQVFSLEAVLAQYCQVAQLSR